MDTPATDRAGTGGEAVAIAGRVVTGDRRGRELGFPTANIEVPPETVLPDDGVYAACFERADGSRHAAALSIGTRPTYYEQNGVRLVEAYLLDFAGDLYGESVAVRLIGRVRGQARFDSSEALIAQMGRDVAEARRMYAAWQTQGRPGPVRQ